MISSILDIIEDKFLLIVISIISIILLKLIFLLRNAATATSLAALRAITDEAPSSNAFLERRIDLKTFSSTSSKFKLFIAVKLIGLTFEKFFLDSLKHMKLEFSY